MQEESLVTYDPKIPKHKTKLTEVILVIIFGMFLIEVLFSIVYGPKALIILGAKWNEGITNGEYWRFITPSFLHGNILHLLLNLMALYIFGRELESIFGTPKYAIVFFITSWASMLTSYSLSKGLAIGASGVAFGIIGCLIIFFYRQKENLLGAQLRFKSMYTLVIINFILGFLIPNIDNAAHLGGLISGLILGWFLSPEYSVRKIEASERLIVVKKQNLQREISGFILIITLLIWLSKLTLDFHRANIN